MDASAGEHERRGTAVPTELQARMLDALAQSPNSSCSTALLATRIGSNRVAIVAAGRALERRGVLVSSRVVENGQTSLIWAIRVKPDSGPGAAENPAADH